LDNKLNVDEVTKQLVKEAVNRGSRDDITAILIVFNWY